MEILAIIAALSATILGAKALTPKK